VKKWRPLTTHRTNAQNVRTTAQSTRAEDSPHRRPPTRIQHQTRLEPEQISQLVAAYQRGATVYELADQFKCHRTTVSGAIKSRGAFMRRTPLTERQIDEAVTLYETGLSLAKVGKLLSANAGTVRQQLFARGVRLRGPHDPRSSS